MTSFCCFDLGEAMRRGDNVILNFGASIWYETIGENDDDLLERYAGATSKIDRDDVFSSRMITV